MKLAYINPNSTQSMTDQVVGVARDAAPEAEILGLTNTDGPAAIEGPEDGAAAIPGVLARVTEAGAWGADAIVIACFDDTGLEEAQTKADCPVLGIGQSAFTMATLLGLRFSVVTSLSVSIPVIEANIRRHGFTSTCAAVRASGLPVLTIDEGAPETIESLANTVLTTRDQDGAAAVVLGCAGMSPLAGRLAKRSGVRLIDGVMASALLATAASRYVGGGEAGPMKT